MNKDLELGRQSWIIRVITGILIRWRQESQRRTEPGRCYAVGFEGGGQRHELSDAGGLQTLEEART